MKCIICSDRIKDPQSFESGRAIAGITNGKINKFISVTCGEYCSLQLYSKLATNPNLIQEHMDEIADSLTERKIVTFDIAETEQLINTTQNTMGALLDYLEKTNDPKAKTIGHDLVLIADKIRSLSHEFNSQNAHEKKPFAATKSELVRIQNILYHNKKQHTVLYEKISSCIDRYEQLPIYLQ